MDDGKPDEQVFVKFIYYNYRTYIPFYCVLKVIYICMEHKYKFAKVKFVTDSTKRTIPINSIIEFGDNLPQHANDYCKDFRYTCWYKDEKNTIEHKYGIQIGLLCSNIIHNCFKIINTFIYTYFYKKMCDFQRMKTMNPGQFSNHSTIA